MSTNKITFIDITIKGDGTDPYVGFHRSAGITTIGKRISSSRMCLIASLANELMTDGDILAAAPGEIGGNHITLSWLNKGWREEATQ
jgi:hypothetical protein